MTNNDFDAENEQLDDDFGQEDDTISDMGSENGGVEQSAQPARKKSGGGFGKILLVLILLGGGGVAGAAKMGFVKLPFDIPGLSPVEPAAQAAKKAPPQPAKAIAAKVVHNGASSEPLPTAQDAAATALQVTAAGALPAPMIAESRPTLDLPKPELQPAPMMPPEKMVHGLDEIGDSANTAPLTIQPPKNVDVGKLSTQNADDGGVQVLMPTAIGNSVSNSNQISAPTTDLDPLTASSAPESVAAAEPTPVVAPLPTVNGSALEGRIQALETKINVIETQLKTLSDKQVKKSDLSSLQTSMDSLRARIVSGAAVRVATPAHRQGVKPVTAHHATVRKATPAVSAKHWVLKSAKPGTAWVSAQGSSDMRAVSVGETLSGIGKIQDISKSADGHWTVLGTQGKINQ